MNHWFTSDTHYGHKNIIKYANRPYVTVEEMDRALVDNWNSVVKPGDLVYHLGDFAYSSPERAAEIAQALKGQKYLILGNHDRKLRKVEAFVREFVWVKDLADIVIEEQAITLCHYGMRVWNKSHHGAWQLYGHSHGTLPDLDHSLSLDVGVDPNGYFPIGFSQIKERMAKKTFVPIDRHGR